jgi:hypothetical protein
LALCPKPKKALAQSIKTACCLYEKARPGFK